MGSDGGEDGGKKSRRAGVPGRDIVRVPFSGRRFHLGPPPWTSEILMLLSKNKAHILQIKESKTLCLTGIIFETDLV